MTTYLTVKEAAQLTGKSPSSIRRIIYPIIEDDAHADRTHVQPSPEDAMSMRMKRENFAWRLSEKLLRREIASEPISENRSDSAPGKFHHDAQAELLAMLRRELEVKNEQIKSQADVIAKHAELISGLSERLREGNVLMGTLQQRLALTHGRAASQPQDIEPKRNPSIQPKKGSTMSLKPTKPKRGFFARLFR